MKLPFPNKVLEQHVVVLGKTGKGKSSVMRVIVEHLLAAKKRVCVIDPKGDWWGLKYSADGKSAGCPVILFGDFKGGRKGDVPIDERSGKHVAELVATGNRPCVIAFSGWTHGAMIRFWISFAQTLFGANNGELYLVGDEFHNFAPKGKIMSPDAGMCLHWSNKILSEGRGLGLVCMIASQRPQKVHNDSLTCCETLIGMGVTHKADRDAVKDWIDGCGDPVVGKDVLNSLAGLQRGEAFVWSPEIDFGPERVSFPKFETFDSFAPPQLQKKVSDADWSNVDLDEVKKKLAAVIQEADANDPAKLKLEVATLKRELATKGTQSTKVVETKEVIKEVEVPAIKGADLARLEKVAEHVNRHNEMLATILLAVSKKPAPAPAGLPRVLPQHTPALPRTRVERAAALTGDGELDNAHQKILDVVAMLLVRGLIPNRDMVARWHLVANRKGIHPNGGSYGQNLGYLRANGYLDGFTLTEKGDKASRGIVTGLGAAMQTVEPAQERILQQLESGEEYDRESLAAALGIHPNGGSYGQNLGRLRTMGLIPERGTIKLTEAARL